MADEIRNPMDVPTGQRTPMEYLQQLFGTPQGSPYEPTSEISAGETFPRGGGTAGPGGAVNPRSTISPYTGTENFGEPEIGRGSSLAPSPAALPSGPSPADLLPPAALTPDQAYRASITKEMRDIGAMGLLPPDWFEQHPEFPGGGVMKVSGPPTRWDMARKLQGFGETIPEMSRDEMTAAIKRGGSAQANIASMTTDRMKEEMDRLGLSYFKMADPEMLARLKLYPGAGPSGTADITGKLYTLLEPARQTKVEQIMLGVIDQVASVLQKGLSGENALPLAQKLYGHIPGLMTAGQAREKLPSEIAELQGRAGVHGATMAETPSKITEREAHAKALLRPPLEHGQDIENQMGLEMLKEAFKLKMDPLASPEQKQQAEVQTQSILKYFQNKQNRAKFIKDTLSDPRNKGITEAQAGQLFDQKYGGR